MLTTRAGDVTLRAVSGPIEAVSGAGDILGEGLGGAPVSVDTTAGDVALAFAGLLILAEVGMFTGIVKGVTATLDRSRADLIILPPKMESLINSGGGSLPGRLQPQMYQNPEVVEVASWDIDGGRWVQKA